jgi:DNA-binding FadR family transcriptional regulator
MRANQLLPGLAAHLFAVSKDGGGRTPSERELAEHFGVSRGRIREALAILEAMRVVERRAKSGIYLTAATAGVEGIELFVRAGVPLDPVQIYETVELRRIHEVKAAELACARATDENFARLREILDASERQLAAGESIADQDRDFHLEIVRATQNRLFHRICGVYYAVGEQRLPIYFRDPSRCRQSHAEHLKIFEALWRRDGNRAEALMNAHLAGALSYWQALIEAPAPARAEAEAEAGKP